MPIMGEYIGAIEAGGTTFRCAIARHPLQRIDETTIHTTDPDTTLAQVDDFFRDHSRVSHAGIASFGPLCLDPTDPCFGSITDTPKLAWQNYPLLTRMREILGVPACIETDVTAAGIAEATYGHQPAKTTLVYITAGTGIGGAILQGGKPMEQLKHSEMGHVLVPRAHGDAFPGICPFHRDCLEGLASGPAMRERWQTAPEDLPPDHVAWQIEAHYLACLASNLIRTVAPERIIFGGGILAAPGLLEAVRRTTGQQLGDYHSIDPDSVIQAPALEPDSGLVGALELAHRLRAKEENTDV